MRSMMVSKLNRNEKRLSEAINLRRKYMKKMMPRPKSICVMEYFRIYTMHDILTCNVINCSQEMHSSMSSLFVSMM